MPKGGDVSLGASIRANRPREILEPKLAPVEIDWSLECKSAPARQALDYYRSLCGERAMPRRHELSPSAMRRFLAHISLVEIVRDLQGQAVDYVMTLEGQHIQDVYGAVANHKLDEVLPPQIVERWKNGFALVCRAARPVRFCSQLEAGGKSFVAGEAVIAPLGENAARIEALFVAFARWQS